MLSNTWYGTGLAAAVVLTLASGCGPSSQAPDAAPTSTSPSPSTAPSPSPSLASTAADGTNLGACADGTCEVRLDGPATIPVDRSLGVEMLNVVSIAATGVTLDIVDAPGGGFSFGCDHHSCAMSVVGASVAGPARGTGSASTGARVTVNRLVIEMVAVSDQYTILRLAQTTAS